MVSKLWRNGPALTALLLAGPVVAAPEPEAHQSYIITRFDTVRMEAPVTLRIRTNAGVSAAADGERATLDALDLAVSGGVLTVRLRPRAGSFDRPSGRAVVRLSTDSVRSVTLSGSGTIELDAIRGTRGDVLAAGSGALRVGAVAVDRLVAAQSGSGRIVLAGRADAAELTSVGTGAIDAAALTAGALRVQSQGSGTVTATARQKADVVAVGPGSVSIGGGAPCTVNQTGNGTVRCGRD
jgi:hypothetical protein